MNDSRRRLFTIAFVYALGVVLVGGHVGYTMVVEHDVWKRRSYTNRWAFRDVPTRRGPIRDRQGELLRFDAPTTAVEVFYRGFRREHPCAIVVHGANLALAASGRAPRFELRPKHFEAAFEVFVAVTFEFVRARADREQERDLRFYAGSFFTAMTSCTSNRVHRDVRRMLAEGRTGSIADALGLARAALRREFRSRLRVLDEFASALQVRGVDLYDVLRRREARRRRLPQTEYVPYTLCRSFGYDDARRFSARQELLQGFRVRPSVRRRSGVEDAHWDSIERLVGVVTGDWGDGDKPRREAILDSLGPEFERMALAAEDVPDDLSDSVEARLRRTIRMHLRNQGRIGRSGIEKEFDAVLRGRAGVQWLAKARGRSDVGLWSTFDVTPGEDVNLTIDLRLQHLLEQSVDLELAKFPAGQDAAAVVVDPNTGDILALVSRPTRANDDKGKMGPGNAVRWLRNGAIGSLAKPLMLAEHLDALRHGRPSKHQSTFINCDGLRPMPEDRSVGFPRHRLRCDHRHGSSVHDCVVSLGVSCNYFFYQVAEGLRWEGIRAAFDRFGLYQKPRPILRRRPLRLGPWPKASPRTQLSIPGIPSHPRPHYQHETDIQRRSIGYGFAANVLHMARAYSGLATGRLPELSLVQRKPSSLRFLELRLHPDDLRVVREGMRYCSERGTARKLELENVWSKTGTAEVGEKVDGHANNNAWLAGFVGLPSRMAFVTVVYGVPHGQYGAAVAGPLFTRFLREVRSRPQLREEYLGQ